MIGEIGEGARNAREEKVKPNLENAYYLAFRHAPCALRLENVTGLRAEVNALRSRGVTDMTGYIEEHPEFVRTAAGLIEVVDVNDAAVRLTGAARREDLIGALESTPCGRDPWTVSAVKKDIRAIARGATG